MVDVRPVEVEAYRHARRALDGMLDGVVGLAPRQIATVLYEQPPPSILSTLDPWSAGTPGPPSARAAQHATTTTSRGSRGRDSTEFEQTMAIVHAARDDRASRVRGGKVDRANRRLARCRERYGARHRRTVQAIGRTVPLYLRAGLLDTVHLLFEQLIDALRGGQRRGRRLADPVRTSGFRPRLRGAGRVRHGPGDGLIRDAVPMAQRPEARMLIDIDHLEYCIGAGRPDRGSEVAAEAAERLLASTDPARRRGPRNDRSP